MATRTVYCFYTYKPGTNQKLHWPRAATRQLIKQLDGVALEDTALEVDESDVDAVGFHIGAPNCRHLSHGPSGGMEERSDSDRV